MRTRTRHQLRRTQETPRTPSRSPGRPPNQRWKPIQYATR